MLNRFYNLSHREQLVTLVGGVLALLMLLYTVLWAPLSERRDNLEIQNRAVHEKLQRVDELAGRVLALRESVGADTRQAPANLTQLVNQRSASHGLKVSRLQPNSRGELQIRFEEVGFNALLSWLHQLEYGDGLRTREVSITRAGTTEIGRAHV